MTEKTDMRTSTLMITVSCVGLLLGGCRMENPAFDIAAEANSQGMDYEDGEALSVHLERVVTLDETEIGLFLNDIKVVRGRIVG